MQAHLPPLPQKKENPLAQILLDRDTNDALAWSLISEVDPHATIGGKSLFQVFCEKRGWAELRIRSLINPSKQPLPTSNQEAWPDPRTGLSERTETADPEVWIGAHLICNGPNPFSWKSADGRDALDYAISWRNAPLLDQLLRMPGAPTPKELAARRMGKQLPWLHWLVEQGHTEDCISVLLRSGLPVDQLDAKGRSALHYAKNGEHVSALLAGGADPNIRDKKGLSVRDTWIKQDSAAGGKSSMASGTSKKLSILDQAILAEGPADLKAVSQGIFKATIQSGSAHFAMEASKTHDLQVKDWRMQEGAVNWSLVGYTCAKSLSKRKSKGFTCAKRLIERQPFASLCHVGAGDVQDIGLFWLAARHYDSDDIESGRTFSEALKRLRREPEQQVAAYQQMLRGAFKLKDNLPFDPSTNTLIEKALPGAWDREIMHSVKDLLISIGAPIGNKFDKLPHVIAFNKDPSLLMGISEMPLETYNAPDTFGRTLCMLADEKPELRILLLQVMANFMIHHPGENSIQSGMQTLIENGTPWDSNIPGSKDRLDRFIQTFQGRGGDWGVIVGALQSDVLGKSTPTATASPKPKRF